MNHMFFEGSVYHKRFHPHTHEFTYPFYLLDIDINAINTLKNSLFSLGGLNLFSFKAKDHFVSSKDFKHNVAELLEKFGLQATQEMRFLTLPRVFNFVFNPISVVVLIKDGVPTHLLAEVHNYNGGNIVYPVKLESVKEGHYKGSIDKDMHVSPFLERTGTYKFTMQYSDKQMNLGVTLYEEGERKLIAAFNGKALPFSVSTILHLLSRQTFLTFGVVTRTLWQSFKLWRQGLQWHTPIQLDQTRRF